MRLVLVLLLGVGSLLLAACAGPTEPDAAGSQQVEITMTDFAFEPAEVTVPAGREVTVVLVNEGDTRHEFMTGNQPMPDDGGYEQDLFEDVSPTVTPSAAAGEDGHDGHGGVMVQLDPGETAEVRFTLPEDRVGEWEIGCYEPGHYQAGMHASLTVTG